MVKQRLLRRIRFLCLLVTAAFASTAVAQEPAAPARTEETAVEREARMAWWREARFGMFIHWGLYAIPAGEWNGRPVGSVGEWIMHIGRIPAEEYETLVPRFNPVKFDADAWAKLAKDAGMRYVVITTKHHDGFALFDSAVSDYDVMATPFRRDIMKELSAACRRHGIRIGWYHSILDWHHPDYLPKRDWQPDRPEADFDAYKDYLYAQVREILSNYGPIDIMWFDGEWDATWTHADGLKMAAFVRELQPAIIINNRVDKARYPGAEAPDGTAYAGDFGTPEQEIPATGIPGVDWETCMTMNDTWGFKKNDHNFKSPEDLIRKLIDIASKGGNFLLNVGPTAEGEIPGPSVERLRAMGDWLSVNGESIYGTQASPFEDLQWGRCTMRRLDGDITRLYLHVFDWPADGLLRLPGIANEPVRAECITCDPRLTFSVARNEDALQIHVDGNAPDPIASVIVLDVRGEPDTCAPPRIAARSTEFVDSIRVEVESERDDAVVRYALDGEPTEASALLPVDESYHGSMRGLELGETTTLAVRHFRGGRPISGTRSMTFTKVAPRPAIHPLKADPGVTYDYYEADCNVVADLLATEPVASGVMRDLDISQRRREEYYGFRFRGMIRVPRDGMYRFTMSSDDGATFRIGEAMVVDHDGIHAAYEKHGDIALAAGFHPFEVLFFEKGGDEALDLWIEGPAMAHQPVDAAMLSH